MWGVVRSLVTRLLHIFSWFWLWNNFEIVYYLVKLRRTPQIVFKGVLTFSVLAFSTLANRTYIFQYLRFLRPHTGHCLPWVAEMRYLGVCIVCSKSLKCSLDECKKKFYRAANSIFGKIGRTASEEEIYSNLSGNYTVQTFEITVYLFASSLSIACNSISVH